MSWSASSLPAPLCDYPGFKQLEQCVNAQEVGILAAANGGRDDSQLVRNMITDAQQKGRKTVNVRDGTYAIGSEVTIPNGIRLHCESEAGTVFVHLPTADGNCFRVTAGSAESIYNAIENCTIYSPDLTFTKCAIELDDVSVARVANVLVYGAGSGIANFYEGGTGSIGLRTKGREATGLVNLKLVAQRPIVIAANPNTARTDGEDIDHWSGRDFYLVSKGHPCIEADTDVGLVDLSLDGYQAWVGGGIKNNDTRVAPIVPSRNISIKNVRTEQASVITDPWFNLSFPTAAPCQVLILENILGAATAPGIKLRGVLQTILTGVTMASPAATASLDIANPPGGASVRMTGCYWQPASTFTLTGYTRILADAWNTSQSQGPNTATYAETVGATTILVGLLSALCAPGTPGLDMVATGSGDRLQVQLNAAGSGVSFRALNSLATAYSKLGMSGTTFEFRRSAGFPVANPSFTIDTAGQTSFETRIFCGTPAGAQQNSCGLYAGTGVPSNADGSNGDYYLRADTPGTALQRLYVKSGGVWVGIV